MPDMVVAAYPCSRKDFAATSMIDSQRSLRRISLRLNGQDEATEIIARA
jgi:hypothetical protein